MRRWSALLAAVGVFAACSDLKRADDGPAASEPDGGTSGDVSSNGGDATTPSSDAGGDVGAPPTDFECSEPWTKVAKSKPECGPRTVKEVDEGAPSMDDISIARTPAGRVAIAFHAPQGPDEGEMRLIYFTPASGTYATKLITRPGNFALQSGYHVKLAASAPDTIHVLAHDVEQAVSGDLLHMRLVNGQEPLTDPEPVLTSLQLRSEIALGVEPATGLVIAAARVTTGTKDGGLEVAKLVTRRKQPGAPFGVMPDLATDLSPDDAPGTGAASIAFDPAGTANVVYHHCESKNGSHARHYVFDGTFWSGKKTVDNGAGDGFSGYGVRLAISGTKKIAAFFYRKGLQAPPATANLRIATWSLTTDTPTIEVVKQGLPSGTLSDPRYRVAMAVDVYGLVHLAVVAPTAGTATTGTLEYLRQTRVDGGGTKWLRDFVDDDVLLDDQYALVDLVVDEKGSPHIAYRSGKDLRVRYATRYDR